MSSMAKLEHYVYINGLLKDFNFLRVLCRHHEFLHKASLLAFLTNTLPLKHPQNFYQNQGFTKASSLQCLNIFFKEWCNVYKIFRGNKKKYGIV